MIRSPNDVLYDDLEDEFSEEEQGLLANINTGRRRNTAWPRTNILYANIY